jgi:hypothetical protein
MTEFPIAGVFMAVDACAGIVIGWRGVTALAVACYAGVVKADSIPIGGDVAGGALPAIMVERFVRLVAGATVFRPSSLVVKSDSFPILADVAGGALAWVMGNWPVVDMTALAISRPRSRMVKGRRYPFFI